MSQPLEPLTSKTGGTAHLTFVEFDDAVRHAPPGGKIVYAVGNLARDAKMEGNETIRVLRRHVWRASARGTVCLTQRRVDAESCQYIATRRG